MPPGGPCDRDGAARGIAGEAAGLDSAGVVDLDDAIASEGRKGEANHESGEKEQAHGGLRPNHCTTQSKPTTKSLGPGSEARSSAASSARHSRAGAPAACPEEAS